MDANANKATLLNMNQPTDETNEPNQETCLITVPDVGDTKIKERKRRCRMEILALYIVCLAACVSTITIVGYFISQIEIGCSSGTIKLLEKKKRRSRRSRKDVPVYLRCRSTRGRQDRGV
ncbi:hypothetical protein CHS0354_026855 [Potamilus streckersoni]|uniref:Uncharacterized protein n=1 Tax=Potamilus streckersoni TaxID=2493646 RepID=A0AAE0W0C2_9BIVA|nr:hypothetical protein CHS0354_026855 [Potamilus streckersoni]